MHASFYTYTRQRHRNIPRPGYGTYPTVYRDMIGFCGSVGLLSRTGLGRLGEGVMPADGGAELEPLAWADSRYTEPIEPRCDRLGSDD